MHFHSIFCSIVKLVKIYLTAEIIFHIILYFFNQDNKIKFKQYQKLLCSIRQIFNQFLCYYIQICLIYYNQPGSKLPLHSHVTILSYKYCNKFAVSLRSFAPILMDIVILPCRSFPEIVFNIKVLSLPLNIVITFELIELRPKCFKHTLIKWFISVCCISFLVPVLSSEDFIPQTVCFVNCLIHSLAANKQWWKVFWLNILKNLYQSIVT